MNERTAPFRVDLTTGDADVQIACARGPMALVEGRALERAVLEGVRGGRTRVVLDLHEVTEVGPGLLGALLRIRRGVTGVNGRLALVVTGPPVSDLVATTLLRRLIDIAADREGALELVGARAHD